MRTYGMQVHIGISRYNQDAYGVPPPHPQYYDIRVSPDCQKIVPALLAHRAQSRAAIFWSQKSFKLGSEHDPKTEPKRIPKTSGPGVSEVQRESRFVNGKYTTNSTQNIMYFKTPLGSIHVQFLGQQIPKRTTTNRSQIDFYLVQKNVASIANS